jgi:hypothetical protein
MDVRGSALPFEWTILLSRCISGGSILVAQTRAQAFNRDGNHRYPVSVSHRLRSRFQRTCRTFWQRNRGKGGSALSLLA